MAAELPARGRGAALSARGALLVDAVGTLVRLRKPPARTYAEFARRFGLDGDEAAIARRFARQRIAPPPLDGVALEAVPAREREGWRALVRAVLGAAAADGPCFDALWSHYAGPEPWQVEPGAAAALDAARAAGLACAVVSNMDARLPGVLAGLSLAARLDALVLPSTSGLAKPDARIFALALARLGVAREAALYVGDREAEDVAAARAAGLAALRYAPDAPPGSPGLLAGWAALAPRLARWPLGEPSR